MSPKVKRNISRIVPFGIIWILLGWIFLAIEIAAIGEGDCVQETAIRLNAQIFIYASIAVGIVGLMVGAIEIIFLNAIFSKYSFFVKILAKIIIYSLILFVIILFTFPIAASMELSVSVFDTRVWEKYVKYLSSVTYLSTNLQLLVSLIASLFYSEISDKVGQRVLINFFTGKYHQPKYEIRIFMFADMNSSTTIAEKLGHVRYFELLNEYYNDFSNAIINTLGEVYQYVGDEIVISWTIDKGVKNNNCLRCFKEVKDQLKDRADWYLKEFGVQPDFKAGIHVGEVTTGEIGALKKEIIFTGDVLNTTARIQALCGQLKEDLIISEELKKHFSDDIPFKPLGTHQLKGKETDTNLFTLAD
ncbi:MAG: adenylate/guanylate cyclase domain-containing protein [Cyclobacteriaceae bacterium]